jgi:hypothetical protein
VYLEWDDEGRYEKSTYTLLELDLPLGSWKAPKLNAHSKRYPLSNFILYKDTPELLIDEPTYTLLKLHLTGAEFLPVIFRNQPLYFLKPPTVPWDELFVPESVIFSGDSDPSSYLKGRLMRPSEALQFKREHPADWAQSRWFIRQGTFRSEVLQRYPLFRIAKKDLPQVNPLSYNLYATPFFRALVLSKKLTGLKIKPLTDIEYTITHPEVLEADLPEIPEDPPFVWVQNLPFVFPKFEAPSVLPRVRRILPSPFTAFCEEENYPMLADMLASGLNISHADDLIRDFLVEYKFDLVDYLLRSRPEGLGAIGLDLGGWISVEAEGDESDEWRLFLDLGRDHNLDFEEEPPLIQFLMTHGAKMDAIEPYSGCTALDWAVSLEKDGIIKMLKAAGARHAADIPVAERIYTDPVAQACFQHDPVLLQAALTLTQTDPLFAPQAQRSWKVQKAFNWLLQRLVHEPELLNDPNTPLCLQLFMDYGADPNVLWSYGYQEFFGNGYAEVVKVNYTALHVYVENPKLATPPHLAELQLRLACGANPNWINRDGKTALDLAIEHELEPFVALLKFYGARQAAEIPAAEQRYNFNIWAAPWAFIPQVLSYTPLSREEQIAFGSYLESTRKRISQA